MVVPIAAHVEAVARMLLAQHLLPYLLIDWTGLRLSAVEGARVGDLDEHRQALLARASIAKNRKPIWVGLHDVLFEAIVASLPPREDRNLEQVLFPGWKGSALRTSITRACRLTGTPAFSPHGLRKRRGSLLGKRATLWPRSPSGSGTRRSSPPSTTCTRSATTPRSSTRPSSPAERRGRNRTARDSSSSAHAAERARMR
jgi:integrase